MAAHHASYILSFNKISFEKTSFDKILRNETTFYGLDRFYINLLLKSCPRLLVLQRIAQNAKSCSKVAEHNLFMPKLRCFSFVSKTAQKLNLKVKFYKILQLCTSDCTCSLAIVFQVDIMNDKTQNNRQKNYFLKFFYSKTKRLILKSKKNRMSTSQNSIQNPSQIRMQFVIFLYRQ